MHPFLSFFFFNDTATTEIYTLPLPDALPIWRRARGRQRDRPRDPHQHDGEVRHGGGARWGGPPPPGADRHRRDPGNRQDSEEHTSELQSRPHLVCRLLLEKKKIKNTTRKVVL